MSGTASGSVPWHDAPVADPPGIGSEREDPMADKKIEPKAPKAEDKAEQNAARVEKKTSLRRKLSKRRKVTRRAMG